MGTVTAIRVREHRARQRLGRACFEIERDEIGLIAALRNTPFLAIRPIPTITTKFAQRCNARSNFWIKQELQNENAE
jgi:hypothetical protein